VLDLQRQTKTEKPVAATVVGSLKQLFSTEFVMPLQPARVKYRKMHRGSRTGLASRGRRLRSAIWSAIPPALLVGYEKSGGSRGDYSLYETRSKVWIRIFPINPTQKPLETRRGRQRASGVVGSGNSSGERLVRS
jgi:hypothetical protein